MRILTAAEMQAADRATIEKFGVASLTLMENAGAAVAEFVERYFAVTDRVVVICGKGNNGGDGFVAARHLANAGALVSVLLLAERTALHGDAAAMMEKFEGPVLTAAEREALDAPDVESLFGQAEVFVDAVYGTGFRPPLDTLSDAVRERLRRLGQPVIAIDVPSGWDASSQAEKFDAFPASAVVTFTAPKMAHAFGDMTAGPIVVAQIGSPEQAVESAENLWLAAPAKALFDPPRARHSNKGRFGHVLVIGGSLGKSGAPSMASLAAMRMGAGLVTAAVPRGILPTVARIAAELMTEPLDETPEGTVAAANSRRLKALTEKISVIAAGPGLSQNAETQQFVHTLVANTKAPLVLDADGLNAFAGHAELLSGKGRAMVITPHPGEMARLLGKTIKEIEADRVNIARTFATEHELIVVLKGWRTLIAHPDGRVFVNTSGNPGMAKGGSGDVLTGLVAGALAQYPENAGDAVNAAVYVHGLAADIAVMRTSEKTFLPTELLGTLDRAFHFRVTEPNGWVWLQGFPPEVAE
jgi:NAD(P)H-hydrate epimerase